MNNTFGRNCYNEVTTKWSSFYITLRLTEGRSSNRIIYAMSRSVEKEKGGSYALLELLHRMSHLSRASCAAIRGASYATG